MKAITLLLDGASDRSYKELDYKTPLQYANTPNLDKLAKMSQCGIMTNYKEGVSLGTDLAHMLLFGYDINEYPSRSIIDAVGEEITINKNDIILRVSFADVKKEDGYIINSRFTHDLSDIEIKELEKDLSITIDDVDFKFIHSYDSHGFVILSGDNLSDLISDSDPFYINQNVMKVEAFENDTKEAIKTAKLVNKYIKASYEILSIHKVNQKREENNKEVANIILTKWAGRYKDVDSFYTRNGLKACLVGNSKLLSGLSKYIQMDYKHYDSFEEAVKFSLESNHEYIHLHTKTPDSASHKKNPILKVKELEILDKEIKPLLGFDGLLIVTSDHSTPCSGKMIHSGESVAFMARGEFVRIDNVKSFDEISCSNASINLLGKDFMNYIINATDRGALYHLRQGSKKINYIIRDVNKLI